MKEEVYTAQIRDQLRQINKKQNETSFTRKVNPNNNKITRIERWIFPRGLVLTFLVIYGKFLYDLTNVIFIYRETHFPSIEYLRYIFDRKWTFYKLGKVKGLEPLCEFLKSRNKMQKQVVRGSHDTIFESLIKNRLIN